VDSCPDALIHKARIAIQNIIFQTSINLGPDARSTVKKIADSTSTVRTTAYYGSDACIADMEIAC
jgi:hypothetical protein